MADQFASIRQTSPGITAAAVAGGSLGAGTIHLWACAVNRSGQNLPVSLSSVTTASGQKVEVTIAATAAQSGEQIFEYTIAGAATADLAQAVVLGRVRRRDPASIAFSAGSVDFPGEGALRAFPLTLDLAELAHVAVAGLEVADPAALPTGDDLVDGMVRQVTSLGGIWVRFDADAIAGDVVNGSDVWNQVNGPRINISSTTQGVSGDRIFGGCDRTLSNLDENLAYPPPPYPATGARQSPAPNYWIANLGSSAIPQGTQYNWRIFRAGQSNEGALAGLVEAVFLGLVDRTSGELDNAIAGVGAETIYSPQSRNLTLPAEIPAGSAAAFEVAYEFASGQAPDLVDGLPYFVRFEEAGQLGTFNPSGGGDKVLPVGDLMRIVPTVAGVQRLGGQVRVANFDSPVRFSPQSISPLATNEGGQRIAINAAGGGSVRLVAAGESFGAAEAQRALVGTNGDSSSGFVGLNTGWSASTAVASGEFLSVTIDHPIDTNAIATIRSNYPDVIAGNSLGDFNVPLLRVFVRLSGVIYQAPDDIAVVVADTQGLSLDIDPTGWDTVASIPEPADPDFGLHAPLGIDAIAESGSSSLPAGDYEVLISYLYTGAEATRISHSIADGNIVEQTLSDGDLQQLASAVGGTLSTYSQARALTSTDRIPFRFWYLVEGRANWRWIPDSTINQDVSYLFSTATTDDPAAGELRLNNADPTAATEIYLSEDDAAGASALAAVTAIAPGDPFRVELDNSASPAISLRYTVLNNAAITGGRVLTVDWQSGSGSISDGVAVLAAWRFAALRPFGRALTVAGRLVRDEDIDPTVLINALTVQDLDALAVAVPLQDRTFLTVVDTTTDIAEPRGSSTYRYLESSTEPEDRPRVIEALGGVGRWIEFAGGEGGGGGDATIDPNIPASAAPERLGQIGFDPGVGLGYVGTEADTVGAWDAIAPTPDRILTENGKILIDDITGKVLWE